MTKPTFGSLFAGIGGFDLGLERAGWQCRWQVEIDDFCNRVLEKHWPHVKRYRDIRELREGDLEPVDLICGGFPCQDISDAGRCAGITGERSGLWREMVRTLRMVRHQYALVENVAALLHRGMGTVLGDLAEIGHDAEWDCLPACFLGAPQRRERVFVLANPNDARLEGPFGLRQPATPGYGQPPSCCQSGRPVRRPWPPGPGEVERIPRMADGLPRKMVSFARRCVVGAYGRALVPQVAEWIGRRILEGKEGEA